MRKSRIQMLIFGVILMLITQIPLFVLASEIDKDEWQKFGTSVVMATVTGVVLLGREIWRWAAGKQHVSEQLPESGKIGSIPILDDTVDFSDPGG